MSENILLYEQLPQGMLERIRVLIPQIEGLQCLQLVQDHPENWEYIAMLFEDDFYLYINKMPSGYLHIPYRMENFRLYHNCPDAPQNTTHIIRSIWKFEGDPPVYHGLVERIVLEGTTESVSDVFNLRTK